MAIRYMAEVVLRLIFLFDCRPLAFQNITSLYVNGTLNNFIYTYYIEHAGSLKNFKTPAAFANGFHDENNLWSNIVHYAAKDSINIAHSSARDKDLLLFRIKALLARLIWRSDGYFEVSNDHDIVVRKALEEISK